MQHRHHPHINFLSWIPRSLVALICVVSLTILLNGTTCYMRWHQAFSPIDNRALQLMPEHPSIASETSLPFDEDIGARIVNNEIVHLTNIINLVDGCGRPFDEIFDPGSRRWDAALNMALPKNDIDSMSVNFTSGLIDFLFETRRLDAMFVNTVWAVVRRFDRGYVIEKQLRRGLKQLRDVQSARQSRLQQDLSNSERRVYSIEVDHLIHTTITTLIGNLSLEVEQVLPDIRNTTFLVEPLGLQATHIAADLDNEVSRVTDIMKDIPWWETWSTWSRIWRFYRVKYFEDYLHFLKSEGPDLRLLLEDIQIFMDNLRTLHEYCNWYLRRQPPDLLKGFSSTSKHISLDDTASAIDELLYEVNLVKADTLRQISEVPPRRPRRVRLLAVPSVLSQ